MNATGKPRRWASMACGVVVRGSAIYNFMAWLVALLLVGEVLRQQGRLK